MPSTLDAIASLPHFADHIAPIWLALPPEVRGNFYVTNRVRRSDLPNLVRGLPPRSEAPTLVAASGDLRRARKLGRRVALMEHGAGQSYGGDLRGSRHASYAGGEGRDAELFLHPGPHPAGRDRARYPASRVEVVGSPRLDSLPAREAGPDRVVAVSFHWDCPVAPEARSAWRFWRKHIGQLVGAFQLIGHGHPRIVDHLSDTYRRLGIEVVASFEEVCRRADVYVCDNSSTLFEFAATGRPVVVLNAPWYRRNVEHGLRFWNAARIGINVDRPELLPDAIGTALDEAECHCIKARREEALDIVYAYRSGAASRAAAILTDWVA